MKITNFERKYSPGYLQMICILKPKPTSEKGPLIVSFSNSLWFGLEFELLQWKMSKESLKKKSAFALHCLRHACECLG